MYINVILCDDDREFIQYVEKYINEIIIGIEESCDVIFESYYSGEELIENISEDTECDLIILDMQMPGLDGDEVGIKFREIMGDYAVLMFCSGAVEPTYDSFRANAYRYLNKHWTEEKFVEELKAGVDRAVNNKSNSIVVIEDKQGIYTLRPCDIVYITILGRGCELYLNIKANKKRSSISISKKIGEIQKMLNANSFASPHRSFCVNLEYVLRIGSKELELMNGVIIPISKHKAKAFQEKYIRYITKN